MVIGITGGVGSGKSTILDIMHKEYGAVIIMADDVARDIETPGHEAFDLIVREFGDDVVDAAGALDRGRLAEIVFSDSAKLERLNSIVHPQVREEISRQIAEAYEADPSAVVVVEAALLIEAGYRDILDEMWCVTVDTEVRIERLRLQRGYTREKTLSIMASQKTNEEYRSLTDFAVDNSGSEDDAMAQIESHLAGLGIYREKTGDGSASCTPSPQ